MGGGSAKTGPVIQPRAEGSSAPSQSGVIRIIKFQKHNFVLNSLFSVQKKGSGKGGTKHKHVSKMIYKTGSHYISSLKLIMSYSGK